MAFKIEDLKLTLRANKVQSHSIRKPNVKRDALRYSIEKQSQT